MMIKRWAAMAAVCLGLGCGTAEALTIYGGGNDPQDGFGTFFISLQPEAYSIGTFSFSYYNDTLQPGPNPYLYDVYSDRAYVTIRQYLYNGSVSVVHVNAFDPNVSWTDSRGVTQKGFDLFADFENDDGMLYLIGANNLSGSASISDPGALLVVLPVPLPPTLPLFGVALLGLATLRRSRAPNCAEGRSEMRT